MGVFPLIETGEAVAARITRDRAARMLAGGAIRRGVRTALGGPLRSIALLYVPYHLYEVTMSAADDRPVLYAADALSGLFDPIRLDQQLPTTSLPETSSRNIVPPATDARAVSEHLRDRLLRMIYQRGFFRIDARGLRVTPLDRTLYLPYWVGFYDNGTTAKVRVLDAVRGSFEGAKVREALVGWLSS